MNVVAACENAVPLSAEASAWMSERMARIPTSLGVIRRAKIANAKACATAVMIV